MRYAIVALAIVSSVNSAQSQVPGSDAQKEAQAVGNGIALCYRNRNPELLLSGPRDGLPLWKPDFVAFCTGIFARKAKLDSDLEAEHTQHDLDALKALTP